MDNSAKNKVIAKNTVALYFRMILATAVAFYASRVVLEVLGITDFGIYNVVGGIVVLLSFLQTSLANSIQRYMSYYATGKEAEGIEQSIYASSFFAIGLIAVASVVFCETVGLWIVNNLLDIPPGRMADANIVYQISIASMVVVMMRAPFEALIIAHERMAFFAMTSVIESVLKLLMVFLLFYLPGQKLIMYAVMVMCIYGIIGFSYYVYSRRNISHVRPSMKKDTAKVKAILSFSGWNAVSGAAMVGYQQGANIILNLFYGVALNATMGIANQVKMAAFLLATNITVAANPQITKSYALKDFSYMLSLICNVSKYAYFLIFTVGSFLILNMDYILSLWLVEVPPQCGIFCVLVVVYCMVDCQLGPLMTVVMAEGNIRNFQIVSSVIMLLNLPLIYIFLKFEGAAWWVIGVQIAMNVVTLVYRLAYLRIHGLVNLGAYFRKVSLRIGLVTLVMLPALILVAMNFSGLTRGLVSCPVIILLVPAAIYFLGLSSGEREGVKGILARFKSKIPVL